MKPHSRFSSGPPESHFNSRPAPRQPGADIPKPSKVFMDPQGRMVDEHGNIINIQRQKELKINQETLKDSRTKDLEKLMRSGKFNNTAKQQKFFDQTLESSVGPTGASRRDKRKNLAFNFVAEGTYVKRGEIMRRKQVTAELERGDLSAFGIGEEVKQEEKLNKFGEPLIRLKQETSFLTSAVKEEPPKVEWWDAFFLPVDEGGSQKAEVFPNKITENDIFMERITHYIQHPIPIKNQKVEADKQMTIPFYLTEAEKKKMRRKKRIEKEQIKQEQVSLGLMPAPEPRVTMKNYIKVLAKEAIQDPSGTEKKVQKIVNQRVQDHLDRNEAGKLTSRQKEEKMKRKHDRDLANDCKMAVFRISKVHLAAQLKFKVDMNAQQLHLGGLCLIADQHTAADLPHLVLVEGGPQAIKRYKKLMLRRIQWGTQQVVPNGDENIDSVKESAGGECVLVWEGIQNKKAFEKWKVLDVRTEFEAKRILSEKGLEHIWNLVKSYTSMRAVGEEPEDIKRLLM